MQDTAATSPWIEPANSRKLLSVRWAQSVIATGLLTIALISFHIRGEIVAASSFSHILLVCAREIATAWVVTVAATVSCCALPRWGRYPLALLGSAISLGLWAYLVYVHNRMDYPRIPGEFLAMSEGLSFVASSTSHLFHLPDIPLLGATLWGFVVPIGHKSEEQPLTPFTLSAIGVAVAVSAGLYGKTRELPWEQDRGGCFRHYGISGLLISDLAIHLDSKNDRSGANLKFEPTPRALGDALSWRPRRILLLQIESLDRSVLTNPEIASKVMPYLSGVVDSGHLEELEVDSRPLLAVHGVGASADCEFATWFGLPPNPLLPWWRIIDEQGGHAALSHALDKIGIKTWSFHGNQGNFFDRHRNYTKFMGFTGHFDREALGLRKYKWGSSDRDFLAKVVQQMNRLPADESWVAHAITFSSHSPFNWIQEYPKGEAETSLHSELRMRHSPRVGDYFASMAYVDSALRDFLQQAAKLTDLILIYGDHPSGVADSGYRDGSIDISGRRVELTALIRASRHHLYPMPNLVSHLDIHATLADAHLPDGTKIKTLGRSLLRPNTDERLPINHGNLPNIRSQGLRLTTDPLPSW